MVTLHTWKEFENNIIIQKRMFYIYGAGKLYQKIIHNIQNEVIAVVDMDRSKANGYSQPPIIEPASLLNENTNELFVLCCIYPDERYFERAKDAKKNLDKLNGKKINFYLLDDDAIRKTGILKWGKMGKLLIDNLCYLTNGYDPPDFMPMAYNRVKEYSNLYIKKLLEEPAYFIIKDGKLALPDFDNGLIIHEDGKKITYRKYESRYYKHTVWIFGDSRVSGMLIENQYTLATLLQNKIDLADWEYKVENCGIPGRDIERMTAQIKEENIQSDDIIILAAGFYEYGSSALENASVWSSYIIEANKYSKQNKCEFVYINLPTILEMDNLTEDEAAQLDIFHKTEFIDYSTEKLGYYNQMIRHMCVKHSVEYFDYSEAFQKRFRYGVVFINMHHYGPNGNQLIADEIYSYMRILFDSYCVNKKRAANRKRIRTQTFNNKVKKMDDTIEITKYVNEIKRQYGIEDLQGRIGCIVMNANPFTMGHLHLVEQSLLYVDYLIVMVVSENSSFFSFEDRFSIVRQNLQDKKQVFVVPSGKFCISKCTFPEYFNKESIQESTIDSTRDVEIFAAHVAPLFGITIRFLGEEPNDAVTRQYNETIKRILPEYDICVVEIQRIGIDHIPISATSVRKHFMNKEWLEIKKLVPYETYLYIKKKYS